ncbi:MAG: hypothetical protein CMM58_09445 [Rhodospirillaceae bacterium]|nr:hypothetical protein [Rhodospirillaceae bacterium]|tara:strand:+ start:1423 stop:3198 length:1776 start_codon:yes stop_codon:yes gene_type:complete
MAGDQSYANGEYIFREGESAVYGYIIKSGVVEIVKHGASGEQVLAELEAPTIFGEMALIDGNPRSAGARAKVDTVVTEVTAESFVNYLRQNPEAAIRIMKTISENLRVSNQLVARYESMDNDSSPTEPIELDSRDASTEFEIDDTDAIYRQGPSKPLLISTLSLLSFFILGVVFASLNEIDTTVSARGEFMTATPNLVVEASASSVVKTVEVERGDSVSKGQIVAYLDDTVVNVNLKQNQEKIDNIYQSLIRLNMEQTLVDDPRKLNAKFNLDQLYFDTVEKLKLRNMTAKLSDLYKNTLVKKVSEYREKNKSFNSKLTKLRNEYRSSKELLKISEKQAEIKRKLTKVQKDLYDRKIGSLLKYLQAKDQLLNAEKSHFNSESAITKLNSEITTLNADKQAFIAQWASSLTAEITGKNEELMQLQQEQIKLKRLVDNIIVKSPGDGVVLDIPAVASGGNVREGDPIITLVQTNQPLFLEVDIDSKEISDMRIGMEVSVKLDAMPFQEFGGLDGELVFISKDTFNESLAGDKGVFYRGRVKTQSVKESNMPADFVLSQGMQASADIKVGKRTLITYFTYPIMKAFEESFTDPE